MLLTCCYQTRRCAKSAIRKIHVNRGEIFFEEGAAKIVLRNSKIQNKELIWHSKLY